MARLHLWAHMDMNFVKKGDRVKAYETKLGTIGTGNGSWYAHNHQSESEGVTIEQLLRYHRINDIEWLKKHYFNPADRMDVKRAYYGKAMDVGNAGYGFLQELQHAPYNKGGYYHPGVDINGPGGGNTDKGWPYMSHVNGTVNYALATWSKNGGWGNIIVVQEDEQTEEPPQQTPPTEDARNWAKKNKHIDSAHGHMNKAIDEIKFAREA